jgi:exo-poly-alpha-galacturonosidase
MKNWMILIAALALTVNASAAKVDARASHRYLITDYGAAPDGITVNTRAIQSAIDKCASSKTGGVVVVPKGIFLSGAIFLKQGVNLLVEKDGVLKGTINIDDYPLIQTRWEGTRSFGPPPLSTPKG